MKFQTFTRRLTTLQVRGGRLTFSSPLNEEAFSMIPGLGDGDYELYGTIAHVPGHGPRIISLSVEFILPEELQWMEQELDDAKMQNVLR